MPCPAGLALQQVRDSAQWELACTGEANPLQSWGPCCCQQQPRTVKISCRQSDRRQQQSRPPQSQHKRETHRGKRLRSKIAASDPRSLPKGTAAASQMCFKTSPSLTCPVYPPSTDPSRGASYTTCAKRHVATLAIYPVGPSELGGPGSTFPCPGSPWATYLRSRGFSLVRSAGSLSL